jgi:hypothetical protein
MFLPLEEAKLEKFNDFPSDYNSIKKQEGQCKACPSLIKYLQINQA